MNMLATVVGAALMAIGVGYLIASSLQLQELQFEINERLPVSDKFEPPSWSIPQYIKLYRFQQGLLPGSPRIKKARQFRAIGSAAFISGVLLLLFGLRGF